MQAVHTSYFAEETNSGTIIADHNTDCAVSLPCIPSVAEHCITRDSVRLVALRIVHAQQLVIKLSERLKDILCHIWKPVTSTAANWSPEDDTDKPSDIQAPRRTILFHSPAVLDANECKLEYLDCSEQKRTEYYTTLSHVVAREAFELGENDAFSADDNLFENLFVVGVVALAIVGKFAEQEFVGRLPKLSLRA